MKLEMCWVLSYHQFFSQVFQNCKLGNTIRVVYVNFFHICGNYCRLANLECTELFFKENSLTIQVGQC